MSQLSSIGELFSLDGKVAVVTGGTWNSNHVSGAITHYLTGSRGLGLHTATAFLLAGAKKVILVSRKAEGKLKSEYLSTHA
jgi:NAD(P)-dependent dehydrogenase (short-subunit alcohol dehydrogenase family)